MIKLLIIIFIILLLLPPRGWTPKKKTRSLPCYNVSFEDLFWYDMEENGEYNDQRR